MHMTKIAWNTDISDPILRLQFFYSSIASATPLPMFSQGDRPAFTGFTTWLTGKAFGITAAGSRKGLRDLSEIVSWNLGAEKPTSPV